jgi:hypothetical protein
MEISELATLNADRASNEEPYLLALTSKCCLGGLFCLGGSVTTTNLKIIIYTVRPMNHMCLTSLQKCNRAWWQMLFHPTALTLEFWNPLTFGQIHLSCVCCALPGWNMTQKIHLLLHYWSIPLSPSMPYFILIGQESLLAPPLSFLK